MQLANILARSGRTELAIALYEEALTLSPDLAPLHDNLATAYFALDKLELAVRHYQRTVGIDPEYYRAWLNLGRVLTVIGRKDDARDALLRAQQLQPAAPEMAEALLDLQRG